ncbi:hypothetical protein MMC14_009451 [Varicellaria rhodocarpa]|nr:hypothetical protein [Varicellaria rhodocarpa]
MKFSDYGLSNDFLGLTSYLDAISRSESLATRTSLCSQPPLQIRAKGAGDGLGTSESELLLTPTQQWSIPGAPKTTALSSTGQEISSTGPLSNSIAQSVVILSSTSSESAPNLDVSNSAWTPQPSTQIVHTVSDSNTSQPSRTLAVSSATMRASSFAPTSSITASSSLIVPSSVPATSSTLVTITSDGATFTTNTALQDLISSLTLQSGSPPMTTVSSTPTWQPFTKPAFTSNSPFSSLPVTSTPPLLTIDGSTYIPNSASDDIDVSQTLMPGGPTIVNSRTAVALVSGGSALVLSTKTRSTFSTLNIHTTTLTIGEMTYTPDSASDYLIASQTLIPGGQAITVSGLSISLASAASVVIIGTSTITKTHGTGGYIWTGIGGGVPNSQPIVNRTENETGMSIVPFTVVQGERVL